MEFLNIFLIVLTRLICITYCHTMEFSNSAVSRYFTLLEGNLGRSRCLTDMLQEENSTESSPFQKYFTHFMVGYSNEYLSEDRWVHNMISCLSSRGASAAYCYGSLEGELNYWNAFGLCIPENCTSTAEGFLQKWTEVSIYNQYLKIEEYHCVDGQHDKVWYQRCESLLMMLLTFGAALAVLIITLCHKHLSSNCSISSYILLAYSLRNNSKRLCEFPKNSDTITCMVGLRALAMIWVMVGHNFAWVQAFIENVDDFKNDITDSLNNIWITNFSLAVDIFFILSAALSAYSFFNENLTYDGAKTGHLRSPRYWYHFYIHRLIRLWPAYLTTIALTTFWFSAMHSHPTWPPVDPAVQCRQYWWHNVLFLNSIYGSQCIGWTWFIGTEFVLFAFSPLLLASMTSSITIVISLAVIAMICASSSGYIAYMMTMYGYPPVAIPFRQPTLFDGNFIEHTTEFTIRPQYHASVYVVGIVLGYVLVAKQKYTLPHRNLLEDRTVTVLYFSGWLLCVIFLSWSIFGLYPVQQGWDLASYYPIYGATNRLTWAFGIAWLIYACHNGYGGYINKFLSSKIFIPLSALSYSMYLLHMIVQYATFLWMPFPLRYGSIWPLLLLCAIQLLITFVGALCLAMIVEYPVINLETLFWRKRITSGQMTKENSQILLRSLIDSPYSHLNGHDHDHYQLQYYYNHQHRDHQHLNDSIKSGSVGV